MDIFSGQLAAPLRLEFDADRLESIRSFDPQSQRSITRLEKAEIFPPLSSPAGGKASLEDYLPPEYRLIWLEGAEEESPSSSSRPGILIRWLAGSGKGPIVEFSASSLEKYRYRKEAVSHPLLEAIPEWVREGRECRLFTHNEGESRRLREILRERGLGPDSRLKFCRGEVGRGFIWEELSLVVVADSEIFSRYRAAPARRSFRGGRHLPEQSDFHPGDYVVHLSHGIGRYLGIKKLEGREKLVIQYADGARLYLPFTGAHLLSRYLGLGKKPRLSRLGGSRWVRTREAAQRAVEDLAGELLEVQARRESLPGHAFSPDSAWQREFEAAFVYPETEDQIRTIREVKDDMLSSRPMDRLICGDVGYGKTEVAVRAAFKAVLDGKQVAILVPTTILAQQHCRTFRERMADYPIRVEVLSRFITARQQTPLVRDLARGTVDIVIGTHRLLQPDVSFKDLGLVVIDEEQRFGVKHKESFKKLRRLVDVLTLTATPIPRTLYLSLTGARDLSTINTPPRDRLAVESRILKYDPSIIRAALKRELRRHGQVYYLYNRVEGIERVRDKVRAWFPRARVEVGHGRMGEGDLARVMNLFSRGEIDILVCTTIIESGLDIPNANTIVVERSDRFGLADLYQLRGRVGRLQRRAYAYFLYPALSSLSAVARRRLQALQEFSHLGAGFSLALRDLEIRGAGNILGRRQHGHIAAIGFDLYCRLLRQSVAGLKGEKEKAPAGVVIRLETPGEISAEYVPDEIQRIRSYKKWSRITSSADLADWEEELKDRFGPLPSAVRQLAAEAELKITAAECGVTSIERLEDRYVFRKGRRALAFVRVPRSGGFPFMELIKRLKSLD